MTPSNHEVLDSGAWMHGRKGIDTNAFLRYLYTFLASSALAGLMVYLYGETVHDDSGALVREFNRVTETSGGLLLFVGALALVIFLCVVALAFRQDPEAIDVTADNE